MYKITVGGRTMVGNNEDSWGRDPRIWFEPGSDEKYGVVNLGYARKEPHPDGAVNEAGLAFDAFTMPHQPGLTPRDPGKKDFAYADIKTIMQQCKNVEEVEAFLRPLNRQVLNGSVLFNGGMLLFVDRSGEYLVVEASKMTRGRDPQFVLANFSIAQTQDCRAVPIERYRKGLAFLENKSAEANLPFCTALSDTMSVNRRRVGDGTLYTNIFDLQEGWIHLYFFHDFSRRVSFNIREELAKGPHAYDLSALFPDHAGFRKFLHYHTPQNNRTLFVTVLGCGAYLLLSAAFFLLRFFRRTGTPLRFLNLVLAGLGISFGLYAAVLLWNEGIFFSLHPMSMPIPYSLRYAGIYPSC